MKSELLEKTGIKNGFTFLGSSGVWVVKLFDGAQYHLRPDGVIGFVREIYTEE